MTPFAGRFWRCVTAHHLDTAMNGSGQAEGRFHHDGQPALYMSPNPEDARMAIAAYVRDSDPPRLVVPFAVSGARLFDLRDPVVQTTLGLDGSEASTLWQPERAVGRPATSWIASDAARIAGADGIIYGARSAPLRWHIVLFRWNTATGPTVRRDGEPLPFVS